MLSQELSENSKNSTTVLRFFCSGYDEFFIGEIERREQAAKIKKLESKIEELKRDKGE